MFTGIIEETGTVIARREAGKGYGLKISAADTLKEMNIGDSISVNGVCLTVTAFDAHSFSADLVEESRSKTAAERSFSVGKSVNLERAMLVNDRIHGHIVQGHVDTTTMISNIMKKPESWEISFVLEQSWKNFLVSKGSIAVDGVSLTIAACTARDFLISVIPHTFHHTIFCSYRERDSVNLEFDILGKYVLNALRAREGSTYEPGRLSGLGY